MKANEGSPRSPKENLPGETPRVASEPIYLLRSAQLTKDYYFKRARHKRLKLTPDCTLELCILSREFGQLSTAVKLR